MTLHMLQATIFGRVARGNGDKGAGSGGRGAGSGGIGGGEWGRGGGKRREKGGGKFLQISQKSETCTKS